MVAMNVRWSGLLCVLLKISGVMGDYTESLQLERKFQLGWAQEYKYRSEQVNFMRGNQVVRLAHKQSVCETPI